MNSYILVDDGIMLSLNMKPYNVERSHPNFTKVVEAVKAGDWDSIPELVNIAKSLVKYCGEKIAVDVDHGIVSYNGEELHNTLTERILRMMKEGFSVDPLVNFLENLMQNPSKRAIDELYTFLEYGKMPITDDGHFLAYKRVRKDYKSVHDGRTDNSIGKVVEMPRNKVDDRSDNTCSHGLHFCSHGYLSSFCGEKVVILKINPRDVVSIPTDYHNTKGRACRYLVVGELSPDEVEKALSNGVWDESVVDDYDEEDRDWLGDWEDEEEVTQDFLNGYERGRVDGRNGTDENDPVIVLEYVEDHEEYVEGYKRGHKDGKGHKARPNFVVAEDDNEEEDWY